MIRYSVVIPERDGAQEVAQQLPRLMAVLKRLSLPFEVLAIDDGSEPDMLGSLQQLQAKYPALRVLQLEVAAGASVALSAGVEAARGEIIIALEPGERYPVEQIPNLISRLSRLDLVCVRQRMQGWRKLRHRLSRIPRALLLGLEVRQPERLFWAARREAVADIRLDPGMHRYLPWMVARRGFRVGDVYVDQIADGRPLPDRRASPLGLLAAWSACRRWQNATRQDLAAASKRSLPMSPAAAREYSPGTTAKVA